MSNKGFVLVLLAVSLITHFIYFGHPNKVVFDEVWYGKHVNDYINGTFHFDGHPPLGRMTVAGFAKVFNYQPVFPFATIGEELPDNQYLLLRFLPSLAGAFLPIVIFLILRELGIRPLISFAGSLLIVFDNGLLVQSRFLLMDAFLLLYGFTSLFLYVRYRNHGKKYLLLLAGIFSGLAVSVKWVGLSFVGLPVLFEGATMLVQIKNHGFQSFNLRKSLFAPAALVVVPLAIYFCAITAYSSLLYRSGSGDAFMSPAYQKTLQGNQYEHRQDIQASTIFEKFYELNVQMYKVNQGLTAGHPYSSIWYTWPLMIRPIYYWVDANARIYFMGNPILWWASTVAILYALSLAVREVLLKVGGLTLSPPIISSTLVLLLMGYTLNLLPYIGIQRIMFLYHYLSALVFAVIIFVYLIDKSFGKVLDGSGEFKFVVWAFVVLNISSFIYFAPLTYGLPLESGAYEQRVWLQSWR